MRLVITLLLVLGAHFSMTVNVPAAAGRAWIGWPFATDSHLLVNLGGNIAPMTQALAPLAAACFLGAALALFGILVPASWWTPLVLVGSASSVLLFGLYLGPLAILPLAIDLILLWGVLGQAWSVASLHGS